MMFEMTNGERIVLDDIEAALRKIEKGDFGVCESCHKKITSQRLKAMPWARYCIVCQTQTEGPSRN
jgi:DnaK suppressor protein